MIARNLNISIQDTSKRPIVTDLVYDSSIKLGPLIIFCHGYKGFKDWGAWPLLSEALAASGFVVIKFNFSHNGGTHINSLLISQILKHLETTTIQKN